MYTVSAYSLLHLLENRIQQKLSTDSCKILKITYNQHDFYKNVGLAISFPIFLEKHVTERTRRISSQTCQLIRETISTRNNDIMRL